MPKTVASPFGKLGVYALLVQRRWPVVEFELLSDVVNRHAPHRIRCEPLGIVTWCRPGSPSPFELCGSALTRESRSSANLAIITARLRVFALGAGRPFLIVTRPNCGLQAGGFSHDAGGAALIAPTHSLPCLGCSKIAIGRIVRHRAGRGCEQACLGTSQAWARSGIGVATGIREYRSASGRTLPHIVGISADRANRG